MSNMSHVGVHYIYETQKSNIKLIYSRIRQIFHISHISWDNCNLVSMEFNIWLQRVITPIISCNIASPTKSHANCKQHKRDLARLARLQCHKKISRQIIFQHEVPSEKSRDPEWKVTWPEWKIIQLYHKQTHTKHHFNLSSVTQTLY